MGIVSVPGLVDMRVQFGEPGAEHKERLSSGIAAAAAGGVTSVAVLPNTLPVIDDPAMLEFVARRARQLKSVKVYPYAALTRGLGGKELVELALLQEAGAVAFTDGERALADARVLQRALAYASALDLLGGAASRGAEPRRRWRHERWRDCHPPRPQGRPADRRGDDDRA